MARTIARPISACSSRESDDDDDDDDGDGDDDGIDGSDGTGGCFARSCATLRFKLCFF